MIIATFGPSTGWVGKTITYDDGRFVLEDFGQVAAQDVANYADQGHLVWAYDGLKEWVLQAVGESRLGSPQPKTLPQSFGSQEEFARWLEQRLAERGTESQVLYEPCDTEAWPWVLLLESDGTGIEIRPGIQDPTGEPSMWLWSLGLGNVRDDVAGTAEMRSAIDDLNGRFLLTVARGNVNDPSLLDCITFAQLHHNDRFILLSGIGCWPDTVEELTTALKAPYVVAAGIVPVLIDLL